MEDGTVSTKLSFEYGDGQRTDYGALHRKRIQALSGQIAASARFGALEENPGRYRESYPYGQQIIELGEEREGRFTTAMQFGIANDKEVYRDKYLLTPWFHDGTRDYYGGYARVSTGHEFRISLDLSNRRVTARMCGHGDDMWSILTEPVPLNSPVTTINEIRVHQYRGAPGIDQLELKSGTLPSAEPVPPHPASERNRIVREGAGFRFQKMRSLWYEPGRHVTITRNPPVWYGFPDVVLTDSDTLVCTYNDGVRHGGGGALYVKRSEDQGQTWSEPIKVYPTGLNCPRIQKLSDGSLLLLADINPNYDVVLFDSHDDGRTWVHERWLHAEQAGGHSGCVPSRVAELANGSWLLASSWYPGMKPLEGTEGGIIEIYQSEDRGRTWRLYSQLQAYPPHSLSEPTILPLKDGRLLLYARENRTDGLPGVKALSSDMGKTWQVQDLPFSVTGRTCAGFLRDGRVMMTFGFGEDVGGHTGIGRAVLWAWVGDALDATSSGADGIHVNDSRGVGLKDGCLHIGNDGTVGQFTQYVLRPPDSTDSSIDLTVEARVLENAGCAATLSVPYFGKFRLFPDRVEVAHDPSLLIRTPPDTMHTYRIVYRKGHVQLHIDGDVVLDTDNVDSRMTIRGWSPARPSIYLLAFGNERDGSYENPDDSLSSSTDVAPWNITSRVTGYSVWRRVEVVLEDEVTGRHIYSWSAEKDGFPDQYQLDHIVEIEGSAIGSDQGYSGWAELEDGRIFVVNYTDDTAPPCTVGGQGKNGIPWIRGTWVLPSDLPR